MPAIAFVNHVPVHSAHTDVASQFVLQFRVTLFDPGGRGLFDIDVPVTVAGGQNGATIAANIASAVRTAAAAEGVTIGANALLMAQLQRL